MRWLCVALVGVACQPRIAAVPSGEPVCDGKADDTAALQRMFDRGGHAVLPPARVCRFSHLTISAPLVLDLAGATLLVADAADPGPFVRVVAKRVTIRDGTIDGGRQTGVRGWLVDWHGDIGVLDTVTLQNGESIGLSVSDAQTRVTAHRTVARGFVGGTGIGFRVGAGALIADDCGAQGNTYAGFFVSQDASSDTAIDAWTAHNGVGVAIEGQHGGRVLRLRSRDDNRFGVRLDHGASDWHLGSVYVESPGLSARNPSGTGVELFDHNQRNTLDEVVVIGAPGYGLAIAGGSSDNQVGKALLDARGVWDGDPGLVIAGGSDNNRIDSVRVLGHTIGVRIGENDLATDAPNNGNQLGTVYVEGAHHNAIRIERGHDNAIREATIADSDSSGSDAQGFKGLVYFGNDSSDNQVGSLVQGDGRHVPNYIVYAGPCTVATCMTGAVPARNRVEHVDAHSWSVELSHGLATPP